MNKERQTNKQTNKTTQEQILKNAQFARIYKGDCNLKSRYRVLNIHIQYFLQKHLHRQM